MQLRQTGENIDMKRYFALKGREVVLHSGGEDLSASDLQRIEKACGATEHVEEVATEIAAICVDDMERLPDGFQHKPLREYFYEHAETEVLQASRAKALLEWRMATRFCGRCGARLREHETLTARICPECGNLIFPRIEPCVITLVHRDGKILLAKHVQRNQNIYALIAGFVEAGETVEHAVEREIFEETHLRVKNIRYFGSQSWPFPSQLMLGFNADYDGGELALQADEIADARWFDPDDCPASPAPGSIAYQLIEAARKKNRE